MKFLILSFIAILSGCTTIGDVKLGMNKKQVFDIMGSAESTFRWGNEEQCAWDDNVVIFENGKVVNKASLELSIKYKIKAESFFGDFPPKRIAMILPSVKGVKKDDLEFIPVKNVVTNILQENGYEVSDDDKKIDTIVFVNFGVSDPKTETKIWSEPVYEYITEPRESSTTTHKVYNQLGQSVGRIESETTHGNPYFANIPQPVYRGERTKSASVTTYTRHLTLEAADYEYFLKKNSLKYFWKVFTTSEGLSDDLRRALPFMGVIAKQIVESETNGKQSGYVYGTDPRAQFLKGNQRTPASKNK